MNRASRRGLIAAALLMVCRGCASTPRASEAGLPHAQCMVCKCNGDLPCIDVTVDERSPKFEYQGRTYYFCSKACRDEFAKHPAKYAAE